MPQWDNLCGSSDPDPKRQFAMVERGYGYYSTSIICMYVYVAMLLYYITYYSGNRSSPSSVS